MNSKHLRTALKSLKEVKNVMNEIEQEVKGHVKKINDYNVKQKAVANKKKKTTYVKQTIKKG